MILVQDLTFQPCKLQDSQIGLRDSEIYQPCPRRAPGADPHAPRPRFSLYMVSWRPIWQGGNLPFWQCFYHVYYHVVTMLFTKIYLLGCLRGFLEITWTPYGNQRKSLVLLQAENHVERWLMAPSGRFGNQVIYHVLTMLLPCSLPRFYHVFTTQRSLNLARAPRPRLCHVRVVKNVVKNIIKT